MQTTQQQQQPSNIKNTNMNRHPFKITPSEDRLIALLQEVITTILGDASTTSKTATTTSTTSLCCSIVGGWIRDKYLRRDTSDSGIDLVVHSQYYQKYILELESLLRRTPEVGFKRSNKLMITAAGTNWWPIHELVVKIGGSQFKLQIAET